MNTDIPHPASFAAAADATATGYVSLADEVVALRAQVKEVSQLVESLESKNAWLRRMVFGKKVNAGRWLRTWARFTKRIFSHFR